MKKVGWWIALGLLCLAIMIGGSIWLVRAFLPQANDFLLTTFVDPITQDAFTELESGVGEIERSLFTNEKHPARTHLERFLKDLAFLDEQRFPQEAAPSGEEGRSLRDFGTPERNAQLIRADLGKDRPFGISEAAAAKIAAWGNGWVEHLPELAAFGIDDRILIDAKLSYHWGVFANGPIAAALAEGKLLAEWPKIDFASLRAAALASAATAKSFDELERALESFRALGRLMISTLTFEGQEQGVQCFLDARALYDSLPKARRRGLASAPYTTDEIKRLQAVFFAWPGYLDAAIPEDVATRVFETNTLTAGACAATLQNESPVILARTLMAEAYRSRVDRIEAAVKRLGPRCPWPRLIHSPEATAQRAPAVLRTALAKLPEELQKSFRLVIEKPDEMLLSSGSRTAKGLRRFLGIVLTTYNRLDYFSVYEPEGASAPGP